MGHPRTVCGTTGHPSSEKVTWQAANEHNARGFTSDDVTLFTEYGTVNTVSHPGYGVFIIYDVNVTEY